MNDESLESLEKKLKKLEQQKKQKDLEQRIKLKEKELALKIKVLELDLKSLGVETKKEDEKPEWLKEYKDLHKTPSTFKTTPPTDSQNPVIKNSQTNISFKYFIALLFLIAGLAGYNSIQDESLFSDNKFVIFNDDLGKIDNSILANASTKLWHRGESGCIPILFIDLSRDADYFYTDYQEISIVLTSPDSPDLRYRFMSPENKKFFIPLIADNRIPKGVGQLRSSNNFAQKWDVRNILTIETYKTFTKSTKTLNIFSPGSLFNKPKFNDKTCYRRLN
ncbi:hypothetical protein OAZ00_01750 [Acidimicrobiia bacterium]|nr:hypothetical protein [Acidimicrobiia bacterium]